jgi:hypothetical protein
MTININRSPCKSCPYRKDVPSGIWEASEYDKILPYDNETMFQPPTVFMCHQKDGSLCRGWLDCHGPDLLGMRLACFKGEVSPEDLVKALEEGPAVPVFKTADLASRHGRKAIEKPSKKAKTLINQIERKRKQ